MSGEAEYEDLDLSEEELEALVDDDNYDNGDVDADSGDDQGADQVHTEIIENDKDSDDKSDDLSGMGTGSEPGDVGPDIDDSVKDDETPADEEIDTEIKSGVTDKPGADSSTDDVVSELKAKFDAKRKALDEALDDGEVDFETFKKQFAAIDREEYEAEQGRTRDIVKHELTQIKIQETWETEKKTFFKDNEYLQKNPILYDAYAREVNQLTKDKAWGQKPGIEILEKAKEKINTAFNLTESKTVVSSKGQKAVAKAKATNAGRKIPATLKDVPAGDDNTDDPFKYLDDLEGDALEKAVNAMSEDEQAAWAMN